REIHVPQVQIGVVLIGLQRHCRAEVGRGSLELSLIEVENPTREEKDVARVLVGIELQWLVKVGLGFRQRSQLFVGKAPKEIDPNEVGLLSQAGIQAHPGRFPLLCLQMADGKEKPRPEMAGLHAEGTVEGVHGLLPIAAPILFLADQEVVERALWWEGGGLVPVLLRLPLLSQLLQEVGPPQVIGTGPKAEPVGVVQKPQRFSVPFLARLTRQRMLPPTTG